MGMGMGMADFLSYRKSQPRESIVLDAFLGEELKI
jgi:hypothetical protein